MIRDLLKDLRLAIRTLGRSRGFSLVVVLSLALGIGANATIFSLVNALFLKPLPIRDPGRFVLLSQSESGTGSGPLSSGPINSYSYQLYNWLRANNPVFEGLAAQQSGVTRATVRWANEGEAAANLAAARLVSASYFETLGVSAFRGRTFIASDETAAGANPVVLLSHEYWQRRFAGNPTLVGQRLGINGSDYTVIGITPPGFFGFSVGRTTDLWVPITMQAQLMRAESLLGSGDRWWLMLAGRLKRDVSLPAATAGVNVTLQNYLAEHRVHGKQVPPRSVRIDLAAGGLGVSQLRGAFRQPLIVLTAGFGLLLVIVCLNVSHVLLARAVSRQHEMVVRTALGASRARLTRQWLMEGLLLSALGAAAGALLARWLIDGLISLASGGAGTAVLDVGVDVRMVAFYLVLALGICLVLGLVPVWQTSRTDLQASLRATAGSGSAGGSRRLASRLLLASQVALSLVLLVSAGLFTSTLSRLRTLDKGFDDEHLLLVQMLPGLTGLDGTSLRLLYDDLRARVGAVPGVRSASLSRDGILTGSRRSKSLGLPGSEAMIAVQTETVSAGYFDTVGMSLALGRGFTPEDREGAAPVAVVNEALAGQVFGGAEQAVGKRFRFWDNPRVFEVVGVVRDARINSVRSRAPAAAYLPVAQQPEVLRNLEVRALGDPALLVNQVRRVVQQVHPGVPIQNLRTIESQVGQSLQRERMLAVLSTAVSLLALFLVSVGLYGVISQWAVERTREIGLRMALGATSAGVRWLVLRQALLLVLAGTAVGLPAAVGIAHLMRKLFFEVSPVDPGILGLAALILLALATTAAYLPARRASRLDPMAALRTG